MIAASCFYCAASYLGPLLWAMEPASSDKNLTKVVITQSHSGWSSFTYCCIISCMHAQDLILRYRYNLSCEWVAIGIGGLLIHILGTRTVNELILRRGNIRENITARLTFFIITVNHRLLLFLVVVFFMFTSGLYFMLPGSRGYEFSLGCGVAALGSFWYGLYRG